MCSKLAFTCHLNNDRAILNASSSSFITNKNVMLTKTGYTKLPIPESTKKGLALPYIIEHGCGIGVVIKIVDTLMGNQDFIPNVKVSDGWHKQGL
eukprot:9148399-Ditylum_brightwellii.AAC.1